MWATLHIVKKFKQIERYFRFQIIKNFSVETVHPEKHVIMNKGHKNDTFYLYQ